jgi:hypothetical protein
LGGGVFYAADVGFPAWAIIASGPRALVLAPRSTYFGANLTLELLLGFGYQEAAQKDAQAQAQEDAEEDSVAAPSARLAPFL